MHTHPALKAIKIVFIVLFAATVLGFAVKELWNALMPTLFGWHTLTFWQALGLLLLSKIFFGGYHRHGGRPRFGRHMRERWEQMSPEDRERLRQGMRCGRRPFESPVEP